MGVSLDSVIRTAHGQAVIDRAGAGAKFKIYNGTRPAGVAAVTVGNTLLATLIAGAAIGVASAAGVDIDESAFTQNPATFTSGVPTFVDVTTSGDVVTARVDIGGAGNWTFDGAVATGQAIALAGLSLPVGNQ